MQNVLGSHWDLDLVNYFLGPAFCDSAFSVAPAIYNPKVPFCVILTSNLTVGNHMAATHLGSSRATAWPGETFSRGPSGEKFF